MTEDAEEQGPAPRPRASRSVIEAAAGIAEWCEEKRREAIDAADAQVRTIWWLLGGGIVLLLVLPRLVALIDYTAASLPPDAFKDAAAALAEIEKNEAEMRAELQTTTAELERLQGEREAKTRELGAARDAFLRPLDGPLAVWREVELSGVKVRISGIARLRDGTLIAGGWEETSEGRKVLLLRAQADGDWVPERPSEAGNRIAGRIFSVTEASDGTLIAGGLEGSTTAPRSLLFRTNQGNNWKPVLADAAAPLFYGEIGSIAVATDGTQIVGGWEQTTVGRRVILFRKHPSGKWTPERPESDGVQIEGRISSVAVAPDRAIFAGGLEVAPTSNQVLLLRSREDGDWVSVLPETTDMRIAGEIRSIVVTPDGTLIAGGWEETDKGRKVLLLRAQEGGDWLAIRPVEAGTRISGRISSLTAAQDGMLIAGGWIAVAGETRALLLHTREGGDWVSARLEADGRRLTGSLSSVIADGDGRVHAGGDDIPLIVTAPDERDTAAAAMLAGEESTGFIVPAGSAERAALVRRLAEEAAILEERIGQQDRIVNGVAASLTRQQTAVKSVTKANADLETALRTAEPVRQASWIVTRVAVVALIIFLVQIVVNRYRYLQRLADFYQARGQAFRMLAGAGPTAAGALLDNVTLNDLMASLSPDQITFAKGAEPPTQQIMGLMQSALKK